MMIKILKRMISEFIYAFSESATDEMEGKIDEAVWVAQVHLHPICLRVQVNCDSLCDNFHA